MTKKPTEMDIETEELDQQQPFSGEEEEEDDDLTAPATIHYLKRKKNNNNKRRREDQETPTSAKGAKKEEEKNQASDPNSSEAKRPNEEGNLTQQAKKNHAGLFQKLWSDHDEVAVLQGLIDYNVEKGKSPFEDMNGFFGFIEKSISSEFRSFNQVSTKIKRLKNKYFCKDDERKNKSSFSSDHDLKCFELSSSIWGPDGEGRMKPTRKSERKKEKRKLEEEEDWFGKTFLVGSFVSLGEDKESLKRRWSYVSMKRKKKLQKKWRLLDVGEFKIVSQKSAFLHEVASAITNAST